MQNDKRRRAQGARGVGIRALNPLNVFKALDPGDFVPSITENFQVKWL